ncbi:MAG: hypothetical protein WCG99_04315 [Candidatus Berkelbacteria bacterium]
MGEALRKFNPDDEGAHGLEYRGPEEVDDSVIVEGGTMTDGSRAAEQAKNQETGMSDNS